MMHAKLLAIFLLTVPTWAASISPSEWELLGYSGVLTETSELRRRCREILKLTPEKARDPAEIKKAITDVMRTGFYLNPFVNKVLIKKNYSKQKFNPNLTSEVVLSDREKEVLTLVCMEFTAAEISAKMDISPRTVEAIKDRLMERFGVKNSVGLVFYAMKNNLIE